MKKIKQKLSWKFLRNFLIIVIVVFTIGIVTVIAGTPPTAKYNPGETLEPNCAPGAPNCTIYAPVASIDGKVGIGTLTPGKHLDVVFTDDTIHADPTDISGIRIRNLSTDLGTFTGINFSSNVLGGAEAGIYGEAILADSMNLHLYTESGVSLRSTKMFIKHSGEVGIGTEDPEAIIHIVSDSFGLFERQTTETDTERTGFDIVHTTTGDMVDGFGAMLAFDGKDDEGTRRTFGRFGAIRDGADTEGAFLWTGGTGGLVKFMKLDNDGQLQILATTGSTSGLLIGGDTNLYRSAENVLKTDDTFIANAGLGASMVTGDPCGGATYTESVIFYNDNSDYYCFCNAAGAGKQLHSPDTACF